MPLYQTYQELRNVFVRRQSRRFSAYTDNWNICTLANVVGLDKGREHVARRNLRPSASFWEAARIAVDSLRKSKLRSFLTLLGIILATSTLIAVTSFVNGMNVYISTKLSNMGSDGFRVVRIAFIGNWDPKKYLEMQRRNPQIKPDE